MFCTSCGIRLADSAQFCQACGHQVANQQKSVTVSESTINATITSSNSTRPAVGGWLLFLCGVLVFASPATHLYFIVTDFQAALKYGSQAPGLLTAVITDSVFKVGLESFGAYCGFLLWKINRRAVAVTKAYLIVTLLYGLIGFEIVSLISNMPVEVVKLLEPQAVRNGTQTGIFAMVWFAYLVRSKRVKATYSNAH